MVASDWTMQRLADILDAPVDRPEILETTALGAAWLAGSRAGVWPKAAEFAKSWALERRFKPKMDEKTRTAKLKGWRDAVRRTLSQPDLNEKPAPFPARAFLHLSCDRSAIGRIALLTRAVVGLERVVVCAVRPVAVIAPLHVGAAAADSRCCNSRCCWRSRRR